MRRATATEVSIPGIAEITASVVEPPPAWALMQRQLIHTIEDASLDDAYETRSGRAQLYYIGAEDGFLDLALQDWNATTRF